jgi:DNA-binding MarR family transcriptional regulator
VPSDDPTLTIARLSRLLENHSGPELSLPQFRVLGVLSGGEERASLLASRLSVAKPTLTAVIDGLVERGFVAREALDGDRRAVRLSITPDGRDVFARATTELREAFDELLVLCADPAAVLASMDDLKRALDSLWSRRAQADR